MGNTLTLQTVIDDGSGQKIITTVEYEGTLGMGAVYNVAANTTNQEQVIALVRADIKLLVIVCSVAMTIKTNSTSSPGNTITVPANTPYIWASADGMIPDPLSADITALYLTNAGSVAGTCSLWAIMQQ
jgi:hypothetical protein